MTSALCFSPFQKTFECTELRGYGPVREDAENLQHLPEASLPATHRWSCLPERQDCVRAGLP